MADISLTEGDDTYVQQESAKDNWENYRGLGGNDTFKIFNGTVVGGPGNDVIEKIPTPGETWRTVGAAYWDSPTGVRVDLQGGWADDGFGGRDTLIGIDVVHATNNDDWFNGNSNDNFFWGNGGNDIFNGGLGNDGVGINSILRLADGVTRFPFLDELDIWVSADGRTATIKPKMGAGTGFSYSLTDIEFFELHKEGWTGSTTYQLSDFISLQTMSEQAIAAGPTLRWNAVQPVGSAANVSFSFVKSAPASGVGAPGFRAFTATEQQLVRDILTKTSAMAGINFTEVADNGSSSGQIRLGVSQQAATKGVSWLPNQVGDGDLAGDIWMDVESMLSIAPGTEGYMALLHEIGHVLGLRHPRNVDVGDSWSSQLRAIDDRTALTVMSSEQSADGLFRADWGPLDVLALRYLYGTHANNQGDNTYTLGSAQALAQTSITDDGGIDVIDASAYSVGVHINLVPGALSSVAMTPQGVAGVENFGITTGSWIESVVGSAFDDVLIGNAVDNRLTGGRGNDWIEGGGGTDTAVFTGKLTDYLLNFGFGKIFVEALDGKSGFDTLLQVERLEFSDRVVLANSLTYSGQLIAGQTLTAVNLLENIADSQVASYQWMANGDNIVGATASSFTLAQNQVGKVVSVAASYTNLLGAAERVVSNATPAIAAATPTLSGTAQADTLVGTNANENFSGLAGDDRLIGNGGNDKIDGGSGTDTAVFTGPITSYRINYNRALVAATITDTAAGRDGTDSLISIEKLQFGTQVFDLINPARTESPKFGGSQSFLFDPAYYLLKNPSLVPTVSLATAFDSFKTTGNKGAAPNSWFDPVYYANKWADLKSLNLDAVTLFAHYNLFGVWEGRSGGPIFDKFDGNAYLTANPDVAAYVDAYVKDFLGSRTNGAIAHYVIYGANEGRVAHDTTGTVIPAELTIEPVTLVGTLPSDQMPLG